MNKLVNDIRRRVALWRNGDHFSSQKTGAEGKVTLHSEVDETKRRLRRNTTYFVHAVIPCIPA